MKNDNYIVIQGWMINELNLKGNDLIIYAIIYGFSQDGNTKFTGSIKYLEKASGVSRNTVKKTLKKLIDECFIKKEEIIINNIKFCQYSSIDTVGQKLPHYAEKCPRGGAETDTLGGAETDTLGGAETDPNNTISNNTNNIKKEEEIKNFQDSQIDLIQSIKEIEEEKEKKVAPKKRKIFVPPTLEEIEQYFFNKTGNEGFSKLEANKFFNHYESVDWKVGKNKMANWNASVNGWITRAKEYKQEKPSNIPQQKITASEALKKQIGL